MQQAKCGSCTSSCCQPVNHCTDGLRGTMCLMQDTCAVALRPISSH